MKVQKCLLYNGTAFPLRDFPEDVLPQSGDKCLLIRDKNLCIPVYSAVSQNSLDNGLMAYWSFDEGAGADTVSDAAGRFPMTTSGHLGIMGGRSGKVGGGWTSNSNSYDGLLSNVSIDPGEYASEFTLNIWFWIFIWLVFLYTKLMLFFHVIVLSNYLYLCCFKMGCLWL